MGTAANARGGGAGRTGAGERFNLISSADKMSKLAMATMIAAFVFFGGFMAYSSYIDKTADEYAGMASAYAEAGDYARASKHYLKSLKKDAGNADALWGMLATLAASGDAADAASAVPYAERLIASDALGADNFAEFASLCRQLGDSGLNASAYAKWLSITPDQSGQIVAYAKSRIEAGDWDAALEAAQSFLDKGRAPVASMLLCQIAAGAKATLPPTRLLQICELWAGADPENPDALIALADAKAGAGLAEEAIELYGRVLGRNTKSAEAYDGLLRLYYKSSQLKDRLNVLEAASRNIGSQKYRDLLETTKAKLAERYSAVRADGAVYRDGIFRITPLDRDGNEITSSDESAISPDDTSYRIEYYDTVGNVREMLLDCRTISARIDDIDYDGTREVVVKKYAVDELIGAVPDDTVKSVIWYDIYRIDRAVNKLIYATGDYPEYYRETYAAQLQAKLGQFERLQEAMGGHYGVAYGLLRALRAAALDFAAGEWQPENTGAGLDARMNAALIVPDLKAYVKHKETGFGQMDGDLRAGGDFRGETPGALQPGMPEADVFTAFGEPRHIVEEEFSGVAPDGSPRAYLNRILEYPFMNFYTSDGAVKAFRINSRDIEGPRFLRIGDSVGDIVNKFPAQYFDEVANYPAQMANADIEFVDADAGIVLSYTVKNGAIADIELFIKDGSGDWRPGTNIETASAAAGNGVAAPAGSGSAAPGGGAAEPTYGNAPIAQPSGVYANQVGAPAARNEPGAAGVAVG